MILYTRIIIGLVLVLLCSSSVSAEEITIVGTGSGPPILKAIAREFMLQYPEVKIHVPRSIGSGGGIKAVGNDEFKLARVARKIKENEKRYGLTYIPVAKMPIVFYANSNVMVRNLSTAQILKIFRGDIFNWQQVGGQDARIRVVRRQDGDSSLSVLQKLFPGFQDIEFTPAAKTTYSDPDTLNLVENTPDTIAFGSYSDVKDRNLLVLSIEDVFPADEQYPYYGIFGLVYKEKYMQGNLEKFIKFATSPLAADPISRSGGLPLQR